MSKEKVSWMRRLLRAFDLPEDPDENVLRSTLIGRRDLLIENHKGISAYTDVSIRLLSAEGGVEITGQGLELTELNGEMAQIRGRVDALRYEE